MKTTTLLVIFLGLYSAVSTNVCGTNYRSDRKSTWGTWYNYNGCCYTPAAAEGVPANGPAPGTTCDWVTTVPTCEGYGCNANDCGDGEIPAECGPLFNPNRNKVLFGQWVRSRTHPDCCYTPSGAEGWKNGDPAPGTPMSGWITTQPTCPGYWMGGNENVGNGPEGEEEHNINKCGGQVWRQNRRSNFGTWYLFNDCCYTPASAAGVGTGWSNRPSDGERDNCEWVTVDPICPGYGCNANDCEDGETPRECGPLWRSNRAYDFGIWVRNPDGCCYTAKNADGVPRGITPGAPGSDAYWITTDPNCPGYPTSGGECHENQSPEEHNNLACSRRSYNFRRETPFGVWVTWNGCCYTPAAAEGVPAGWSNRPSDGERTNCDWITVDPACAGYGCRANDCGEPQGENTTPQFCGPLWRSDRAYAWGQWVRNPDGCCYTPRTEGGAPRGSAPPGTEAGQAIWVTTDPVCPGYDGQNDCDNSSGTPEEDIRPCGGRNYRQGQSTSYGTWVYFQGCCYTPALADGVPAGWSNRPSDGERTNCDWITVDPACPGYGCRANDCGQPEGENTTPQFCGPLWRSNRAYSWGQWVRNADGCCYTPRTEGGAPNGSAQPGTEAGRAIWVTTDPNCPGYDGYNDCNNTGETPEENTRPCGGRNYRQNQSTSYGTWVYFQGCCYTPAEADGVPAGWSNRPSDGERENCDWITVDPACPGYGCRANDCSGSGSEQVAPNCGPRWNSNRAYPWGLWVRNADGCCYTAKNADGVPANIQPGTSAGAAWWTTTDPACPGYQSGGSGTTHQPEDTGNFSTYCGAYEWQAGRTYPWATYVFKVFNGKECCYAAFVYPEVPANEVPGMSGCWITTDPSCPGWGGGAD